MLPFSPHSTRAQKYFNQCKKKRVFYIMIMFSLHLVVETDYCSWLCSISGTAVGSRMNIVSHSWCLHKVEMDLVQLVQVKLETFNVLATPYQLAYPYLFGRNFAIWPRAVVVDENRGRTRAPLLSSRMYTTNLVSTSATFLIMKSNTILRYCELNCVILVVMGPLIFSQTSIGILRFFFSFCLFGYLACLSLCCWP